MGIAYSEPNLMIPVAFNVDLGTATASGTNTLTDKVASFPKFLRKQTIHRVRVRNTAAPNSGGTIQAILLNGTTTAGYATISGRSLDDIYDFTMVTAAGANVIDADVQPTLKVDGTSTASGQGLGDLDIWFEIS